MVNVHPFPRRAAIVRYRCRYILAAKLSPELGYSSFSIPITRAIESLVRVLETQNLVDGEIMLAELHDVRMIMHAITTQLTDEDDRQRWTFLGLSEQSDIDLYTIANDGLFKVLDQLTKIENWDSDFDIRSTVLQLNLLQSRIMMAVGPDGLEQLTKQAAAGGRHE